MKKYFLPVLFILLAPAFAVAQSATVQEVTETIMESTRYLNENMTGMPGSYSSEGALEFWSSGGLLNEVMISLSRFTLLFREVADDVVLVLAIGPESNIGKARFMMRRFEREIRDEL